MLADRTFSRVAKMLKCYHLAYKNYVSRVRGQVIPQQVALVKENTNMPSFTMITAELCLGRRNQARKGEGGAIVPTRGEHFSRTLALDPPLTIIEIPYHRQES